MKNKRYTTEDNIRLLRETDQGEKSIAVSLPHEPKPRQPSLNGSKYLQPRLQPQITCGL